MRCLALAVPVRGAENARWPLHPAYSQHAPPPSNDMTMSFDVGESQYQKRYCVDVWIQLKEGQKKFANWMSKRSGSFASTPFQRSRSID